MDAFVRQILQEWAEELSVRLGRPAAAIGRQGLSTQDFPSNEILTIAFPDGSSVAFRFAFCITHPSRQQIAVFTEHCGYHLFPAGGARIECVVKE